MRRWPLAVALVVLVAGLVVSLATGSSGSGSAGRWVIRDLGTLGGVNSEAVAINDRGQVVGYSGVVLRTGSLRRHAFLWENGQMRDLGVLPGRTFSTATALNDAGEVVGYAANWSGLVGRRAFLWSNGRMVDLGALRTKPWRHSISGVPESIAVAVGPDGQIVGWSHYTQDATGRTHRHAFIWEDGRMRDLKTLGGRDSRAVAISATGIVVGSAEYDAASWNYSGPVLWGTRGIRSLGTLGGKDGEGLAVNLQGQAVGWSNLRSARYPGPGEPGHAFLWESGKIRDLGSLGGPRSSAVAINNRGQAVGWAETHGRGELGPELPPTHAVLWEKARIIDLGTLGGQDSEAIAINEAGQVIGWSATRPMRDDWKTPPQHAFVWENGRMHDLGTIGWAGHQGIESSATAINNHNQIVGYARIEGARHAVLWTKTG